MHWINRAIILLTDGVHQVDDGQHCYENSQRELRLVEESFRDLLVAAMLNVIDLEDGEQPQEGTRCVYKYCLLETRCEVWTVGIPR